MAKFSFAATDALKVLAVLEAFNNLKKPPQVYSWDTDGTTDIEDAVFYGDGQVRFNGFQGGQAKVTATYTNPAGGKSHLIGKVGIVAWSWRESIQWDVDGPGPAKSLEVEKDDIYISSHLQGDEKYMLLDFIFTHKGQYHRFRFIARG